MVLMEIYRIFEQRKNNIDRILSNGHSMALEKKHELQGAKDEIETFLKTLEYYYNEQGKPDPRPTLMSCEQKGFFARFQNPFKKA
ncbi:MAG: hypothetical protein ABIG95_00660 [Candidatus Woesearchaeota archaeon]